MCLCIESLHALWLERCRIVHESMASSIKVEDHHYLLMQVRTLFNQIELSPSSILHQYKHRLHHLPTETLRGITYQLLTDLNVDSHETLFHNDIKKQNKRPWRKLTPATLLMRDQATRNLHQRSITKKRQREDFLEMAESRLHRKCRSCN